MVRHAVLFSCENYVFYFISISHNGMMPLQRGDKIPALASNLVLQGRAGSAGESRMAKLPIAVQDLNNHIYLQCPYLQCCFNLMVFCDHSEEVSHFPWGSSS